MDLQLQSAPSGELRDFLASGPYRGLDLASCLLEDLRVPEEAERKALERDLYLSAACFAAGIFLNEQVLWDETGRSCEHGLLSAGLLHGGLRALAKAVPGDDALALSQRCWNEHAAAMSSHQRDRVRKAAPFTESDCERVGHRWSPLKAPVLAAAMYSGRGDLAPQLDLALDQAATLFQISRDLFNVNRDLARGHFTFPIVQAMTAAGMDAAHPPPAMGIMLALMVTRAMPDLARKYLAQCAQLQGTLERLGLPALGAMLQPLAEPFQELSDLYESRKAGTPRPAVPSRVGAMVLRNEPQLQQALQMARGFLLADPELRECWETHRWGLFNTPLLNGRVFPSGMVLELLSEAGVDCSASLGPLFDRYVENRYHYFEEACALPPDTDTVGLMLRLTKHGVPEERAARRKLLELPLSWLKRNVREDGNLPVFLLHGIDDGEALPYPRFMPEGCQAVVAGCLLGLLTADAHRFQDMIQLAAGRLCEAFSTRGMAAVGYYDAPYTGWIMLTLANRLGGDPAGAPLAEPLSRLRAGAVAVLEDHACGGSTTHQDAAMYLLAAQHAPELAPRAARWAEGILRRQRYDGSWDACPGYLLPNRGNVAGWYGSRTFTSAFCHNALALYARREG